MLDIFKKPLTWLKKLKVFGFSFFSILFGKRKSNLDNTSRALKRAIKKSLKNNLTIEEFSEQINKTVKKRKQATLGTFSDVAGKGRLEYKGANAVDEVKTWVNVGIFDSLQTMICRAYKGKKWVNFSDIDPIDMPPRHFNCRSKIVASTRKRPVGLSNLTWKRFIENSDVDIKRRLLSDEEYFFHRKTDLNAAPSLADYKAFKKQKILFDLTAQKREVNFNG